MDQAVGTQCIASRFANSPSFPIHRTPFIDRAVGALCIAPIYAQQKNGEWRRPVKFVIFDEN